MITFSNLDIIIILVFFGMVMFAGFLPALTGKNNAEEYLLSGRKVGLFLFVLTNVATWYGGILGVGEFTYRYGLLSWFTQGLPYYLFAFIFAIFLAPRIREASLFTIPDKIESVFGKPAAMISAAIVFILVSPAPYLLMIASLISIVFGINLLTALIVSLILSIIYMFKSGYKSDLYTDALEFFVMFIGFAVLFFTSTAEFGGIEFLENNLPSGHLSFTGDSSVTFIVVWFLIALWTFADPGFHQRSYAAKSGNVAKYGIIISIFFWALFDFLTTSTGLFARASLQEIDNPVLAFPLYAEQVLGSGLKGIFYAGLFATILSTLNSFLFLSATTFSRDFISKFMGTADQNKLIKYTRVGLLFSGLISVLFAYMFQSVVEIWYTIGSLCIPGIILLVIGAYYEKLRISARLAVAESITAVLISLLWLLLREYGFLSEWMSQVEPMVIGLLAALLIHLFGMHNYKAVKVQV